jgi:hypothetical protein
MMFLKQARAFVEQNKEKGVTCPCCDQYARTYKRKINATMIRSLIWIIRRSQETDEGWVDVPRDAPKWVTRTNQHTTLKWWGMLERKSNDDSTKKHSGIWRPTPVGIQFVHGQRAVPEYVLHYNNTIVGWSDTQTDIREALQNKFDYQEMMAWAG